MLGIKIREKELISEYIFEKYSKIERENGFKIFENSKFFRLSNLKTDFFLKKLKDRLCVYRGFV